MVLRMVATVPFGLAPGMASLLGRGYRPGTMPHGASASALAPLMLLPGWRLPSVFDLVLSNIAVLRPGKG